MTWKIPETRPRYVPKRILREISSKFHEQIRGIIFGEIPKDFYEYNSRGIPVDFFWEKSAGEPSKSFGVIPSEVPEGMPTKILDVPEDKCVANY